MQIPIPSRVAVYESGELYGFMRQGHLKAPEQLGFAWCGRQVKVDGMTDPKYGEGIKYMGLATHVFDDVYRCLAVVGGALCVVEVTIRPHDDVLPSSAT